ncbi:MAG TPA: PhoH family protein, partial [Balneolaceae bacterium]|nr:PhoH family protein [Balneolaceae bacterium]
MGFQDENLRKLEEAYPETTITARGGNIKIKGSKESREQLKTIIHELVDIAVTNESLTESDVDTVMALHDEEQENAIPDPLRSPSSDKDIILHTYTGDTVTAKTPGQQEIVKSTQTNDIVFTIGPAGTGKTFTSVALAVRALKQRKVKKIVLA